MAAISISDTTVVPGVDCKVRTGVAGVAIIGGLALYKDTDGTFKKAQANAAGTAKVDAISVGGAEAVGQPFPFVAPSEGGSITIGGTMAQGQTYYLSDAVAGEIIPLGDLGAGDFPVIIGIAKNTTVMVMKYFDPDVAKA